MHSCVLRCPSFRKHRKHVLEKLHIKTTIQNYWMDCIYLPHRLIFICIKLNDASAVCSILTVHSTFTLCIEHSVDLHLTKSAVQYRTLYPTMQWNTLDLYFHLQFDQWTGRNKSWFTLQHLIQSGSKPKNLCKNGLKMWNIHIYFQKLNECHLMN